MAVDSAAANFEVADATAKGDGTCLLSMAEGEAQYRHAAEVKGLPFVEAQLMVNLKIVVKNHAIFMSLDSTHTINRERRTAFATKSSLRSCAGTSKVKAPKRRRMLVG